MGTDPPRAVRLRMPAWLWGSSVLDFLRAARLGVADSDKRPDGGYVVEASERQTSKRPGLVACYELDRVDRPDGYAALDAAEGASPAGGQQDPADAPLVQRRIQQLAARTRAGGSLAGGLVLHQLQIMSAPRGDASRVVRAVLDDLRDITLDDGSQAFLHASAHLVRHDRALFHRARLPAVLLRLEHDPQMRAGDLTAATASLDRGDLVFDASGGLSDGLALLDAYLAPALGALTPFVWAVPATRLSGTLVLGLGHPIAGASGEAAEPLQLLPARGPSEPRQAPVLPPDAASAAMSWWARRLDRTLATLTDPAVHSDGDGAYLPAKHLHALLSVEQLFRRVGAIQRADRDSDARQVMLFSVLDTLERLNGRSLIDMCTLSFARKVRARVAAGMPLAAASVLMPAADRALEALRAIQDGFYLPKQLGIGCVDYTDAEGRVISLPLDTAAAEYMRLLRNATHGHGSNRTERKALTNTLLVQHSGYLPHDLALLGYLYLLELLSEPTILRRTLYAAGGV